jgi:hypothetical protein
MRSLRHRVVGATVLVVLVGLLLGGCELREGAKREYGESSAGDHHDTRELTIQTLSE